MVAEASHVYYPRCRALLHIVFDGFGDPDDDSEEFIIPVLPKAATIHRNAYKQADSYDLTFDASDLPVDPELIRSGAAEIFLFQSRGVIDDDFVVSRQLPTTQNDTGFLPRDPSSTIALDAGIDSAVSRWTLGNRPVVAGLFDDVHVDRGSGGRWVTVQGQDYTAYLAGRQWPPTPSGHARRIPVGKRIDTLLTEILREADPRHLLRLVVRGTPPSDLPTVGAAETAAHGRGIPIEQNTSYWDVMYKLAIRAGFILFVDGLDVVLAQPQNLTAGAAEQVRQFRLGRNVESLTISRKMGKLVVPTIIVQGWDPKRRQPITAEYPSGERRFNSKTIKATAGDVEKTHTTTKVKAPPKKVVHHKKPGTRTTTVHKKDEYEFIPAHGVHDPAILARMAENLYHLLGRAERKVVLKTKDLKDLRESNLLDMTTGSAVMVAFDDFNRDYLASGAPADAKVGHLMARGYGAAIAQALVKHATLLSGMRRPLKVREVTYTFGDDGISIELELVDFVVIDNARQADVGADAAARRDQHLRRADGSRLGLGHSAKEERTMLGTRRAP